MWENREGDKRKGSKNNACSILKESTTILRDGVLFFFFLFLSDDRVLLDVVHGLNTDGITIERAGTEERRRVFVIVVDFVVVVFVFTNDIKEDVVVDDEDKKEGEDDS